MSRQAAAVLVACLIAGGAAWIITQTRWQPRQRQVAFGLLALVLVLWLLNIAGQLGPPMWIWR